MGRIPCCVKRGQWTPEEDNKLSSYIAKHGTRNWRLIPKNAGLQRCGKSCRLRWTNYLHPDLKHGEFSKEDEQTIIKIHSIVGNRWSIIAARLPGRTDNDVKNHWNTKLKKQLTGMGIDPVTHKPISHLIAEISNTLEPPHVAHLAEAALGCFKDEMVHLLTKMHIDFQLQQSNTVLGNTTATYINSKQEENDQSIEKIKFGLSRAMHEPDMLPSNKFWDSNGTPFTNFSGNCSAFPLNVSGFQHGTSSFSNEESGSPWNQSLCTGSSYTAGERQVMQYKVKENGENSEGGKEIRNVPTMFNSDSVLWDLPSDDLMNPLM